MSKHLRILFFFVVFSLLSFISQAQIKLQPSFANDLIILGNISSGSTLNAISAISGALAGEYSAPGDEHKLYCRVYKDQLTIGILVVTGNSFDDNVEIALGDSFETTNQSLQDILDWLSTSKKGESITFDDIQGRHVQLNRINSGLELKVLNDVDFKVIVGDVYLNQQNLTRAQNLLNDNSYKIICDKLINLGLEEHPFIGERPSRWAFNASYTIPESKDILSEQKDKVKKSLKEAKKANDEETTQSLQDELNILEVKEDVSTLAFVSLKYFPEKEKQALINSVIEGVRTAIAQDDTIIAESGIYALQKYDAESSSKDEKLYQTIIELCEQFQLLLED